MRAEEKTTVGQRAVAAYAAIAATVGLAVPASPARAKTIDQVERYCATSWRNAGIHPQDWSDCTQEAISQLLERVPQNRLDAALDEKETPERRELKRAIWRTIQRWRRAPRLGSFEAGQLADSHDTFQTHDERDALDSALRQVTPRQQQILGLWSEGYSIDEIARQLNISPAQASDQKYKAIRKLQKILEPA